MIEVLVSKGKPRNDKTTTTSDSRSGGQDSGISRKRFVQPEMVSNW